MIYNEGYKGTKYGCFSFLSVKMKEIKKNLHNLWATSFI